MSLSINISDDNEKNENYVQNSKSQVSETERSTPQSNHPTTVKYSKSKRIPPKSIGDRKSPKKDKKRGKKRYFFLFLILILCAGGAFAAIRLKTFTEEVGIELKPTDIIAPIKKDPELKRDSSGVFTNALLVGIDTRTTNQGLQNTDTIIVASYNHNTSEVTLVSIPRDTYAYIPNTKKQMKINGIYNQMENQYEDEGLDYLRDVVEDYVGMDIQYYGMVDVIGLTKVIDILGGVDVVVENSFTDYAYPNETNPNKEYQTVTFKSGLQTMDGETAVKYARSRKSLQNGEGSDFARARRQQILIESLKNKVLSAETLLDPNKMLDIMVQVQENITVSEFSNEDIQAGLKILKDNPEVSIHSFVLDPYTGARNVVTEGAIPGSYALTPVKGIGKYEGVHDFIERIQENPLYYEEAPRVRVYDVGIGYYPAYEEVQRLREEFPYTSIVYQGTLYSGRNGVYVYDNTTDSSKPVSVITLINALDSAESIKPEFVINRLNGEDITILLGAPLPEPIPETIEETPTTN